MTQPNPPHPPPPPCPPPSPSSPSPSPSPSSSPSSPKDSRLLFFNPLLALASPSPLPPSPLRLPERPSSEELELVRRLFPPPYILCFFVPVVASNTLPPPPLPLLLLFTGFLKTIFPPSVSPPAESSLFAPSLTEVSESGGEEEGSRSGEEGVKDIRRKGVRGGKSYRDME